MCIKFLEIMKSGYVSRWTENNFNVDEADQPLL